VAGALGRTGSAVSAGLVRAAEIELTGGFGRHGAGEPLVELLGLPGRAGIMHGDLATFFDEARPEVVVDFTVHPVTVRIAHAAVERGISPVIGATGWSAEELGELARVCDERSVGAVYAPNFALGAVLMMQFAERASRFFDKEEILEMHHDQKRDAPSGTARLTAARLREASGREVPIHSVRLPGLVAHQEVMFGAPGETLTIRHDSLSRESFVRGVLLAVRRVRALRGLIVGLDALLEAPA
jgi:4-hydroxy-tetrahydrodipicolinate reductase